MALEFKLADFAYPVSLLRLRAGFAKSQWYSRDQQILHQEERLRSIVQQAYWHVPYYRELFDRMRLRPEDIRHIADLQKLPILTKKILRDEFGRLQADNRSKFRPQTVYTSGTTGTRVQFLVDKPSNVLEFVYYWRHWNWAGYRLGDRFAEFSTVFFQKTKHAPDSFTYFQRATNRLLLNSSRISAATIGDYVTAIRKFRPLFLKGLPSAVYYFALFLRQLGIGDIKFKAVFCTGERLLPRYRQLIEATLRCKVYDSYGHMERTVAMSECPSGGLHVNPDYGVLELVERNGCSVPTQSAGMVVGTSLYCYSMPLLRYEVGDFVQIEGGKECACGRRFPLVRSIDGRQSEVIITPEGEVIPAAFLVFEETPDILAGQILQESLAELRVRIVPMARFSKLHEDQLVSHLRKLVGPAMRISVERYASQDSLHEKSGKLRPVVSKLESITT
jgi:phenylacetate-CoA ligase